MRLKHGGVSGSRRQIFRYDPWCAAFVARGVEGANILAHGSLVLRSSGAVRPEGDYVYVVEAQSKAQEALGLATSWSAQLPSKAPSFHIIDHVTYHTTLDTADLVPVWGLEDATRAFLKIIDGVNKMTRQEIAAAPTDLADPTRG